MKVLFIAPLPPPVHGSAMVSQYIKDSRLVNEQFDCDFVNLSTSRRMDEIGKGGIKKLLRFVGAYFSLLWKLLTRRYDLCYLAITCHDMGFLKDAPFVLLCKLFRRRVLIHQHNKGMSRCVDRWPYRWLLPLVYRNTTVMLLSWHLYDDIASVVKREQVVICANGVPPLQAVGHWPAVGSSEDDNGAAEGDSFAVTKTKTPTREERRLRRLLVYQHKGVLLATLAKTPSGVSTEGSQLTDTKHYTLNAQQVNSHADSTDYTEDSCLAENINLTQNTQNSRNNISEQDNQRELDTITQNTHCYARVGHPEGDTKHYTLNTTQELSHADSTDYTEDSCLAGKINLTQNTQNTQNSQNGKSLRPCGHPEGTVVRCPLSVDLIETEAPRLLFLSNLIPSKGVYVLLDACKVLRERGLQFVCDFVGGETKEIDRATFETAVKERGLGNHVIYHGPQYGEDKHRFFMNADVFVQPTFDDCFPLTLVEAMQYSLPIASTDVGAIPDMVQDGVNGFVCKQQDVDSLVNALEQLITNPALRQQMGEAGYQRYKELYTLEAFEKRFVELLSV